MGGSEVKLVESRQTAQTVSTILPDRGGSSQPASALGNTVIYEPNSSNITDPANGGRILTPQDLSQIPVVRYQVEIGNAQGVGVADTECAKEAIERVKDAQTLSIGLVVESLARRGGCEATIQILEEKFRDLDVLGKIGEVVVTKEGIFAWQLVEDPDPGANKELLERALNQKIDWGIPVESQPNSQELGLTLRETQLTTSSNRGNKRIAMIRIIGSRIDELPQPQGEAGLLPVAETPQPSDQPVVNNFSDYNSFILRAPFKLEDRRN